MRPGSAFPRSVRVTGWHVDGFGLLHDHHVGLLPPGLTVVLGPNEAGKSTLVDFLRGALFGFPDRRARIARHEPVSGGRHGGRLFLAADDGPWVVERHTGRTGLQVTRPDGSRGGADDLGRLLGHADAELFRNVFAFSLTELQSLESLDRGAGRERIFTAGVVGAGRSAQAAIKALEAQRTTLVRARGASAARDLRVELQRVDATLAQAVRAAASHPEARADMERAADEVQQLAAEISACDHRARRSQTLVDLWPDWTAATRVRAELARSPAGPPVDAAAEADLARAEADVEAARAAVADHHGAVAEIDAQLAAVVVDDRLASVAHEVRDLAREGSAHRARLERLAVLRRSIADAEMTVAAGLRRLGPSWDLGRVAGFDTSIPVEDGLRSWDQRLRSAEQAVHAHEAATTAAAMAAEQAEQRSVRRRREADAARAEAVDPDLLDQWEAEWRRRRVASAQGQEVRTGSRGAGPPTFRGLTPSRRAKVGVLAAVAAVVAVVAVLGAAARRADIAAPAVLAAAVAVGVTWVAGRRSAPAGRRTTEIPGPAVPGPRAGTEPGVPGIPRTGPVGAIGPGAWARTGAGVVAAELTDGGRTTHGVRPPCAGEPGPGCSSLDEVEDGLAALGRHRLTALEGARRARDAAEAEALSAEAGAALRAARARFERSRAQQAATAAGWAAWRQAQGVSEPLGPSGVHDLCAAVSALQAVLSRRAAEEAERSALAAASADHERRAHAVLGALGQPSVPDPVTHVEVLDRRVDQDALGRRSRDELARQRASQCARLAGAEVAQEQAQVALAAVLAGVDAPDADELRARAAAGRRRPQLEAALDDFDRRARQCLGTGPEAQAQRARLGTGDLAGWQAEVEVASREARALEAERDRTVVAAYEARRRVEAIETSADVAGLQLERAGLAQQLRDVVTEWQTVSLARALVERTLASYERERQPTVMRHASELFGLVTAGRYVHILARSGADDSTSRGRLDVVDADGRRLAVEDLSRGTAEQLYLCLRFGLAAEFAANAVALPIVMDDVVVNFDPERARAVAEVVADVATRQQVLVFTCHPATVARLRAAAPDVTVVGLDRHGGTSVAASAGLRRVV